MAEQTDFLSWYDYQSLIWGAMDQIVIQRPSKLTAPLQLNFLHEMDTATMMINTAMAVVLDGNQKPDGTWTGQAHVLGYELDRQASHDNDMVLEKLFVSPKITYTEFVDHLLRYTMPNFAVQTLVKPEQHALVDDLGLNQYTNDLVNCVQPLKLLPIKDVELKSFVMHERSLMTKQSVKVACHYMLDQLQMADDFGLTNDDRNDLRRTIMRITSQALKLTSFE